MPFVIGIMGLNGSHRPKNEAVFHKAQAALASLSEFKGRRDGSRDGPILG